MLFFNSLADYCEWATLAFADSIKPRQMLRIDCKHITLLRLVAPDLQRRHLAFSIGNIPQFKYTTPATVFDELRQRIRKATGTHIVDECDGILVTQLPALIDNLLATSLHLRVLSLH